VVPRKKSKTAPAHAPSRKRGASPRKHHMQTDLTSDQKKVILDYCSQHNISVSQFLAEIAVGDARATAEKRNNDDDEEMTLTFKIPRDKRTKLAIFAQRRGETIEDHVRGLLLPWLEKQKTSFPLETESLRYYLDSAEHALVMKQLKKRGLSARNYVSFLALQTVNQSPKKKK
jgi:hypothetical protein